MLFLFYITGVLFLFAILFSSLKFDHKSGLNFLGGTLVKNIEVILTEYLFKISNFFNQKDLPSLLEFFKKDIQSLQKKLGINANEFLLSAFVFTFTSWAGVLLLMAYVIINFLIKKFFKRV